jgi:predicted DNA-binding transcriptional regulator AlpA
MPETLTLETLAAQLADLRAVLPVCFLRGKEVADRYGWSERTFHRRKQDPGFPAPVEFPGHGWKLSDLLQAELDGRLPCPVSGKP